MHFQATVHKPTDHQRINGVFLYLNASGDFIFVIAFKDRNFGLQNDRPAVEFVSHKVDRSAMLLIAIFQCPAVGVQTVVFGQQEG